MEKYLQESTSPRKFELEDARHKGRNMILFILHYNMSFFLTAFSFLSYFPYATT